MKNVLSGTQCACRSWWNTSKHFFWFRVQALISLWVLLIYYLTLLLVKWEISHTADSTPHLIRDYVLTLWLNEIPLNNNNNNNNNHHYHHFRGEIAELNQILINLTTQIPLHSCYHINDWSGLPVIWQNRTFFLCPVPLSPWCCFPNRNAVWNYSEWSHWISLLSKITPWKAAEGMIALKEGSTFM